MQIRHEYYAISEIPKAFIDGDVLPYGVTEPARQRVRDSLAARLEIPSPMWMSLRGWVNTDADTVFMEVKTVADTVIGPGHRLHMALAQIHQYYEYDAYGAMLHMSPDGYGQPFVHSGNVTDTLLFAAGFAVADTGLIDCAFNNLRLVAWVQDSVSKEVLQSCFFEFPHLFAPRPGDTLYVGIPSTIRWAISSADSAVTLDLNRDYPDGLWETVFDQVPNDGSAEWVVTGPATEHARFRIQSAGDSVASDTMDGDFVISEPATITISPDPISVDVLAGDSILVPVTVINTASIPAHVVVDQDLGMTWVTRLPPLFYDIGPGAEHVMDLIFWAQNYSRDTTLTGNFTFSGNLLPVTVPVIMHVTANAAPDPGIPLSFSVSEAYPNPFNPSTTIRFTLEKSSRVKMIVYSSTGQTVATLLDYALDAGTHLQQIDGSNWATGLYFLRIDAAEHHEIRKLLLLK